MSIPIIANRIGKEHQRQPQNSNFSYETVNSRSASRTSRIPIRLQSPGPFRRSVSQRLRASCNNRRSSSLTNSPTTIGTGTNNATRRRIETFENGGSNTTGRRSVFIERRTKRMSDPISLGTVNTTNGKDIVEGIMDVKLNKGFEDIDSSSTSTLNVYDNTEFSDQQNLLPMNTDTKTSPTKLNLAIITKKESSCDGDGQQNNCNNIEVAVAGINGCCGGSTTLIMADNNTSDNLVKKSGKMSGNLVMNNGPISPISEEECGGSGAINLIGKSDMKLNLNGPVNNKTDTNGTKPRTPKTPHTPRTPSGGGGAAGPTKLTPKTPPVTPDSYNTYFDDDLDSLYSYSSGRSTMSCDHPYVARNGTTFSGRKMKYVVHCSSHAGQVGQDYLTPTQRAQRQLRRLKEMLIQARLDLEQKDSELCRLTREVVELRLFKASLSSPEDRSNSSDAVTVREAPTDLKTSQDVSPIVDMTDDGCTKSSPRHLLNQQHGYEMQNSFADSGHFEDMSSVAHSSSTQDQACGNDTIDGGLTYEEQRDQLIQMYEQRIEELIRNQDVVVNDTKQTHNDRVEALLQKLAECNSRYADIVPDYEQAKERIRELEKQMDDLEHKLLEQDDKQKKMYLHMYTKGQEAEKVAHAEKVMELAHRAPNRVSIPELLQQLQSTQDELENIRVANNRETGECALLTAKEAISLWVLGARKTIYRRLMEAQHNRTKVDPEVTLQFLKSAIYYFLTDKENSQGHLKAIESILEFTEQEKVTINKARAAK